MSTPHATPLKENSETLILAGGCFWCLEKDFLKLDGVTDAISGYSGGTTQSPTYQTYNKVPTGETPHVEVVEVTYDAQKLTHAEVLDYYLRHIDPTDGGGQFCDRGAGYRPVMYYANEAQKQAMQAALQRAETELKTELKVEILPATTFWRAEDYHQRYAEKNPIRYQYYRWNCGRDQRVKQVWGTE